MTANRDTTVYVVFPVHNRIDATKRFLETLAEQTVSNYKLVICDDGSTDGTGKYISDNHPEVTVLEGNGHLWWAAGINKCVDFVLKCCRDTDYILTLNNDVLLPEQYIERKLARAKEFPKAIIGSLCVHAENRDMIETSGYIMDFEKCRVRRLTRPGDLRNESHKGVAEVTHLPGKGVMVPVEVYKALGLYDEVNFPQYHADTDLVLRAYKKGYQVLVDFDSVVFSEVNENIMAYSTNNITLKGMLNTFGPYAMNNYRVYNNFAKKHFPDKRRRYLLATYTKTIGGMLKRYLRSKF